jgi:vitamin K-dependent gamma-carboxylase
MFLGFTYVFLMDRGHYNNHFYFYSLLLFLFMFVNSSWGGLQNKLKEVKVPYWQILILQLQIFIVYFFGAVAKLDSDWLQGVPLQFWMWQMTESLPQSIQGIYRTPEAAIFFSYLGLIFDLVVGFCLISRRFKRPVLILILLFHLQNIFFFDIGTFPIAMLGTTILFANPKYGEYIYSAIGDGLMKKLRVFISNRPIRSSWKWFRTKSPKFLPERVETSARSLRNNLALSIMLVWFIIQALLPFRQHLYKGNPSWTGEGHLFAWRMMLVDTTYGVRYWMEDPQTKEQYPIAIENYISFRQFYKMSRTPKSFLLFAHFIRDEAVSNGNKEPIIRMEIYKSVNFREPIILNDTTLNYSRVEYSALKPVIWINNWKPSDQKINFDQSSFENWRKVIDSQNSVQN